MPNLNFNSVNPGVKFLIVVMVIATIGVIVFFTGLMVGRVIFWMHLDQVNDVLFGRYELLTDWQLKYFQMLQTIAFFIVPAFFINWLFSTPSEKYFKIYDAFKWKHLIGVFGILLIGTPIISWLADINQKFALPQIIDAATENSYSELAGRLLSANNFGIILFNVFLIAVLPAIGEELIFRGVLQKLFTEISKNSHIAVIVTALLFSALHGQFYGILPRFVLGLFLGYLMVWSKSVWLPIVAHFINNVLAMTFYYLYNSGNLQSGSAFTFDGNSYFVVISASMLLTVPLIVLLRKSVLKYQAGN